MPLHKTTLIYLKTPEHLDVMRGEQLIFKKRLGGKGSLCWGPKNSIVRG
jgi:hypothetical protein